MKLHTVFATALLGCALTAPLALAAGPRASVPPLAAPTPPVTTQPWYAVHKITQRCAAGTNSWAHMMEDNANVPGPALAMEIFDAQKASYTMDDVTEQGEIVQTTMLVLPTQGVPNGTVIRWYRSLARCEQAQRTEQQAREQQRAKYQ
jgi:hypothetical protein